MFSPQTKRNILSDPSLLLLLFSNLLTIFFALRGDFSLSTIMWIYWFQSITIGFFNFVRILSLKEFLTEGFKIDDKPAEPTQSTKIVTAFFFLFHYGFFHFGYLIFLLNIDFSKADGHSAGSTEFGFVFFMAMIFFINHLFSYFYNKPRHTKKMNIGSLMFYPYVRIFPMHLTIVMGSVVGGMLPLFLFLKTLSDAIMHVYEHRVIRAKDVSNK